MVNKAEQAEQARAQHDAVAAQVSGESVAAVVDTCRQSVQQRAFVSWFRSVTPYIHMHRGETFVVGICGEAIADGRLNSIVHDLALIQSMGVKIIIVYGFRPQVNEQLAAKGHQSVYHNGVRITDSVALDCAQEAAGQLRYEIEAAFSQGLPNTPMSGATIRIISGNFITAKPLGVVDGVDFKHTGVVRKLDAEGIKHTVRAGVVVLISPFGFSPTGEAFNLSMEEVATSVASAVQADKLIFLTEEEGIRDNPQAAAGEDNALITEVSLNRARRLLQVLESSAETEKLAFYLRHCVQACEAGVERSHILPYAVDGVILQEIYTHDGIGTMIVDEKLEFLRQANADDVGSIIQLIEPFERDGSMIKRNRTEIETHIRQYSIIEHDGVIFGCAALQPYPERRTGEMYAVTVSKQSQGQGDGERLLKHIEQRARAQGLTSIFVLSTRTTHWFIRHGFQPVEPDWLPEDKSRLYNRCRNSKVLVKRLA